MKIAICGNYGVFNCGDEAILESLRSAIARAVPDAEVSVLGKGMHLPFGVRSVLKTFVRPQLFLKPYREIASCDAFILGGGGLFTDEEGITVPTFWALHGFVALLLKKPLLCLGLSIGPLNKVNAVIVHALLRRAAAVTVRDSASEDLLKKWGIPCENTSDLAFLLPAEPYQQDSVSSQADELHSAQKYVVVSIRQFKNNDTALYTKIAQLCDMLIGNYGLCIKFLPFQRGGEFDARVMNIIFDHCKNKKNITIEPYNENILDSLKLLKGATCVIGMRLHAGILAASVGTPFIPLVYMQKVSDFWREFPEIEQFPLANFSLPRILTAFKRIYNHEREHRSLVQRVRQKLRSRAEKVEKILIAICKRVI